MFCINLLELQQLLRKYTFRFIVFVFLKKRSKIQYLCCQEECFNLVSQWVAYAYSNCTVSVLFSALSFDEISDEIICSAPYAQNVAQSKGASSIIISYRRKIRCNVATYLKGFIKFCILELI